MKLQLQSYFFAEKWEGLAFVLVGVAAITLAALLWRGPYRGMGVPLVLVALIQISVGGAVFLRTDRQEQQLLAQLETAPSAMASAELARMHGVMANFKIYKLVELCIFALGVLLTYAFAHREFVYSIGIGCVAQGAFMLVLDLFAEHRGDAYMHALKLVQP
jgi:hypothetical protein